MVTSQHTNENWFTMDIFCFNNDNQKGGIHLKLVMFCTNKNESMIKYYRGKLLKEFEAKMVPNKLQEPKSTKA